MQSKNIGWESGQQKRASHHLPELKESLQLKWHDMEGRWPSDQDIADFEATSKVSVGRALVHHATKKSFATAKLLLCSSYCSVAICYLCSKPVPFRAAAGFHGEVPRNLFQGPLLLCPRPRV